MLRKISLAPLIMIIIFSFGCASLQSNTYKTLAISKTTYDTVLSTAAGLYKAGKITDKDKDEIILAGKYYKHFHNAAVGALLQYKESGDISDEETYLQNVSLAARTLAEMIDLIQSWEGKE